MTDYFSSWCLVCEKQIPADCIYCSESCQCQDFRSTIISATAYSLSTDSRQYQDFPNYASLSISTEHVVADEALSSKSYLSSESNLELIDHIPKPIACPLSYLFERKENRRFCSGKNGQRKP